MVLMLLFLVAFLRNFSLFTPARDAITEFLTSTRTIGDLSFTFWGIALFFLVLYLSASLSSAIKFLSEDKSYYKSQKKTANIAVILRFLLITAGFFLALLVSGIPMDRIAIILGALSVGIGFGLQNIVNNLISGIILVFERPIQTGDVVELQQYTGLVKDIGIRSSIIKTYDGAEVIVPNGHLISQEVINWTLSNRQRRVEVMVGVAYGSKTEKVVEILQGVMENHQKLLKLPAPQVLFSGLGDSSLNFTMRFWTSDIDHWVLIQSEITTTVYNELNQAGISIPFPQRDLHIKSWDGEKPVQPKKTATKTKPADQASKKG
jgi:small-conductance mechanosensitive channel